MLKPRIVAYGIQAWLDPKIRHPDLALLIDFLEVLEGFVFVSELRVERDLFNAGRPD
jgi:hypothetical protein